MRLKYIVTFSLLTLLPVPAIYAQTSPTVSAIESYVYPQNRTKTPKSFVYMPDGNSYLQLSDDGTRVTRFDTSAGTEIETIFDCTRTRETKISSIEGFTMSADGSRLLVYRNSEAVYRNSFTAEYYVYEIKRNILLPLSTEHPRQEAPVISPNGLMVAFVSDNNIYLKKLVFNTEIAVTDDGRFNEIINGIPDWVYQEEFKTECSISWSPDCTTLCYLKYNESKVPIYNLPIYDSYCKPDSRYSLYPGQFSYKYPVAGEANSVVTLHSYDIDTRKTKQITFDDKKIEYIPRIEYIPGGSNLLVSTLNREQNRLEVYSVNPKSTVVKSILVEESDTWINPETYEEMVLKNDHFIIRSTRSGYEHLYRYNYSGVLESTLTSGDFNVTAYYGSDKFGNIYYQSTATGPLNRVVSKQEAKTGKIIHLTPTEGTSSATFSPAMNYYTLSYSSIQTPPVYSIISTDKNKEIRKLEDNAKVAAKYRDIPKKEFLTLKSDGYDLNAYMIKPSDFNPDKKYPVIMFQYSGPGSQQVVNRWSIDWQYFAAKDGFIVVCVDGRGTGGRERRFETCVYKNLGHYETIDQVNAAHEIAKLPFVDGNRIGMNGWSFGGYETLMCASATRSPFKAAVAIAPVTDWRLYDTIYTERYMSTPEINEDGYNESAPLKHTDSMNTRLLLITGTADDNVHPANTIEYVSSLQANNRLCSMLLFPNMNHSINGCNSRSLVYGAMMDFFKNNL